METTMKTTRIMQYGDYMYIQSPRTTRVRVIGKRCKALGKWFRLKLVNHNLVGITINSTQFTTEELARIKAWF